MTLLTFTKFVPVIVTALPTAPLIGLTPVIVAAAEAAALALLTVADPGAMKTQIRPTVATSKRLCRGAAPHMGNEVRPALAFPGDQNE